MLTDLCSSEINDFCDFLYSIFTKILKNAKQTFRLEQNEKY